MRLTWRDLTGILVDPIDRSSLAVTSDGESLVSSSGRSYRLEQGCPVLLPSAGLELGGWRFPPIDSRDAQRPKPQSRGRGFAKRWKRVFEPAGRRHVAVERFREALVGDGAQPLLLVVGGATEGEGLAEVARSESIGIVAFDIYPTRETTFVADAHRIPLADGSVDGVIVQAVLEHVYRPDIVVAEIERVLRPGGLVYAETPFLQPVHEGAFDFTRFTVSGHRLLFSGFEQLSSGPIGGPGAMLNLACRGLSGGMARSPVVAKLAYAITLPCRLLDRLVDERWRRDFAIGAYFLGRRREPGGPIDVDPVEVFETFDHEG